MAAQNDGGIKHDRLTIHAYLRWWVTAWFCSGVLERLARSFLGSAGSGHGATSSYSTLAIASSEETVVRRANALTCPMVWLPETV